MFKYPEYGNFGSIKWPHKSLKQRFDRYADNITSYAPNEEWTGCTLSRGVNSVGIDDRPRQTTLRTDDIEIWFWGADITSISKTSGDKAMLQVFELKERVSRPPAVVKRSGVANEDESPAQRQDWLAEATLNAYGTQHASSLQKDGSTVFHAVRARTGEIEVIKVNGSGPDKSLYGRAKNNGLSRFFGKQYKYYHLTENVLNTFYKPTRAPSADIVPFTGPTKAFG